MEFLISHPTVFSDPYRAASLASNGPSDLRSERILLVQLTDPGVPMMVILQPRISFSIPANSPENLPTLLRSTLMIDRKSAAITGALLVPDMSLLLPDRPLKGP